MAQTFFFYDLETSGLDSRSDRVMQFAGQRTTLDLEPVGEPVNELIALSDDTIPSPEALLITGITPQKTVEEGYTEAEFTKKLASEYFSPDTIVVGYNNIRFDDEFIRYLLWRNFHDPYEWSWKDGRSRWDLLDVVRMTRALRPSGIEWPVNEKGEPTNRLELITKLNGISHESAHDALSDVQATIDVARLIKQKQPQLFDYLFQLRDKKELKKMINLEKKQPFVYVSGRYEQAFEKTTVAFPLTSAPHGNVLVYDLRYSPKSFLELPTEDLSKRLFATFAERQVEGFEAVPVKQLQYNRCPAVAPLAVLDVEGGWGRIGLSRGEIDENLKLLLEHPDFAEKIRSVFEDRPQLMGSATPEASLYDGFLSDTDRLRVETVRQADAQKLADLHLDFHDERLPELLLHYKARNYPKSLSESEMTSWEEWRASRLHEQLPKALEAIEKASKEDLTDTQQYILAEIQLWVEGILPEEN